jgi:hypothetical protein
MINSKEMVEMEKIEIINKMKREIKWQFLPRGLNQRSKEELINLYNEAKKLGFVNRVIN